MALLKKLGKASDVSHNGNNLDILDFEPVNQYAAMVDSFARSVAAGLLEPPAEDGLAQMRVLDQLLAAATSD